MCVPVEGIGERGCMQMCEALNIRHHDTTQTVKW